MIGTIYPALRGVGFRNNKLALILAAAVYVHYIVFAIVANSVSSQHSLHSLSLLIFRVACMFSSCSTTMPALG